MKGGALKLLRMQLLFLLLFLPVDSPALDPEKSIRQMTHEAWTRESSLPQASVQSIIQSSDGYIWLGTQEGLVRFDGVRFVQMNSEDAGTIWEDRDGSLWIASPQSGVLKYRDGKTEQFGAARGLSSGRCNSLWMSSSGMLWVATTQGLNCLRDGRFTSLTKKDGLPTDDIQCVLESRGGIVWAGTREGLARLENGRIRVFRKADGLPSDKIACLMEGSDGTVWIGTFGGGLCSYRKGIFRSYGAKEGMPAGDVRALFEDRDGNVWIGFEPGGLTRLRDGAVETFTAKDGLSDSTVWSIYEDREGSLWVGTFGGGLNRFKDTKFSTYDISSGLSSNSPWTIYESSDKTVWIGTDEGLDACSGGKVAHYRKEDGLPNNSVNTILEDRDGAIWIGTDEGLSRFRDGRFTNFSPRDGLTNPAVYSLCEDREGTIWIATNGGGVNILKNGSLSSIRKKDGLSDDYIRAILEDRQGNMWIGTNGAGLNRYRDGVFTLFAEKEGLSNLFIRTLYEDRQGNIWIGTRGGGLCRYREGKIDSFRMADGLLSDVVFQILEDGQDNLWMSCNKGIFRVSKRSLEDFAAKKISSIPCTSFGRADGMKSPECTGGTQPAGWKTRDGVLWFPTIRGVVSIDPQRMKTNEVPPPTVIEEVMVDGRKLDLSGEVVAPAGSDRIEFEFTALSFLAPEKVIFKYFLEGHDKDWITLPPGRERVVSYTSIRPGSYAFRVKACNNDGLWNEQGSSLPFRLEHRFRETWFFYSLVIFAMLILGGLLYHLISSALVNFRIGKSLARYHSRHVIENLRTTRGSSEPELSTERRRLTIMFGDLLGFSPFSDKSEPEVVDRVINEYLTEMANIIESKGGTIARFMGDGIMAFFGAPAQMDPQEQAKRAVEAAVFMQKKMAELEKKWLASGTDHTLKLRLGISQDYATVGNMGSKHLMEYTALGSAVNLAARLETGCTPGKILVSFPVYAATKEIYPYDEPVMREFKGFARHVNVAELDPSKIG